ncbi:MAG: ACP S-malonyltransferase [Eubacteriales bacterium]
MDRIAFVFSGQGAQHPGMGEDFYGNSDRVRALFDAADAYRPGTKEQCFHGTDEELKQTANTQPCLYLTDLSAALALEEAGIHASAAAGFSLGELPALAFSGAFTHETGFAVTAKRGALMGEASTPDTAMAAVLKLENRVVEDICAQYEHLTPVNYNAPGQLVVSGLKSELNEAAKAFKAAGGRAVPLAVSGAFHSPYMDVPAKAFADYLKTVTIGTPRIPVYANYTAKPYEGAVIDTLAQQMNHPVRWEETVRHMADDGITVFIECGVGNTLIKLISKIAPDAKVFRAETMADIASIREALA